MRRSIYYSLVLCLLLLFWIAPAVPGAAQSEETATLVIEGGTLIDGNGGEPVRDAVVVIRGGKIEAVSRKGQVSYPAGAQIIQAGGKFILPGMTDTLFHYADWAPELLLAHGVTTVFDTGGGGDWIVAQREGIADGKIPGPQIFAAIGPITGEEGARGAVHTPEAAREKARQLLARGPDFIKAHRGLTAEAYKAIVEEARKAGLMVVSNPIGPTAYATEAVLAGVDGLQHATGVAYSIASDFEELERWPRPEMNGHLIDSVDPAPFALMDEGKAKDLIDLLVKNEVYLEPNFVALGRDVNRLNAEHKAAVEKISADAGLAYVPEGAWKRILGNFSAYDGRGREEIERMRKGYQNMQWFIRQFVQAGGIVTTGTDAPGWAVPGLGVHHELELLVDAGLTPLEALQAATRNPARVLGKLDQFGTIEAGKRADIIIVNEDPLQDIRNLKKIHGVIQNGKLIDRTYHPDFRNPLPKN